MHKSIRHLPTIVAAVALVAPAVADFDLKGAIRDAAPGSTIEVPVGVYCGTLVVDRSVTLRGAPGAIIDGRGDSDVVRISAPGVVFCGFTVRGSGDSLDRENCGILVSAPDCTIEQNTLEDVLLGMMFHSADRGIIRENQLTGKSLPPGRRGDGIRLWNSNDCRVERNTITGVRDVVIWYSRGTHLTENDISAGRYGLHFMYGSGSVLERNRLTGNSVGVFLMYSSDIVLRENLLAHNRGPSGYGLGLKDMENVTVENNIIASNRCGAFFDNSPQRFDGVGAFRGNVVAYNDIALSFTPSTRHNRFADNSFIENVEQVAVQGGGEFRDNDFTPGGVGNYWSDYVGFDADNDGVGDMAYHSKSLFEDLMDREPSMRLFLYSPAQQAVELAARAFPIVQPQPKVSDKAPQMRPRQLETVARLRSVATPLWSVSAFAGSLLVLASLIIGRTRSDLVASSEPLRPRTHSALGHATPQIALIETSGAPGLLVVRELRKRFARHAAVDGLSFEVSRGQALALWGTNGAGKTTVIKCLLGLCAFEGSVHIAGHDVRLAGKAARRNVGYVSQELSFYDDLSAGAVATFFARLRNAPLARVAEVLAQVGLAAHQHKRVAQLSGGMKQRLALGVALLTDPPLLLLDEPTSNLDAAARRQFIGLLCDLRRTGKTIVFTTHRPEEVAQLADRLIILKEGRTDYDGAPVELDRTEAARMTLRLPLEAIERGAACDVLRSNGFEVSLNHAAVLVRVAPSRKAQPISLLNRSGFQIDDFEVESEVGDVL